MDPAEIQLKKGFYVSKYCQLSMYPFLLMEEKLIIPNIPNASSPTSQQGVQAVSGIIYERTRAGNFL